MTQVSASICTNPKDVKKVMLTCIEILKDSEWKDETIDGLVPLGLIATKMDTVVKKHPEYKKEYDWYGTTMSVLRTLAFLDLIAIRPCHCGSVALGAEPIPDEKIDDLLKAVTPFTVGVYLVTSVADDYPNGWKLEDLAEKLDVSPYSIEYYFRHFQLAFDAGDSDIKCGIRLYEIRGTGPRSGTYVKYEFAQ